MKYIIFIIILLFLNSKTIQSCPTYPQPVKINQNDERIIYLYEKIDQIIQNQMKLNNIKSFIATIIYIDEIVWSKTYGTINPLEPNSGPVTIDNNIEIASLTKLFTDLMMFKLRDEKIIGSIDDEIEIYYPNFKIQNLYNTSKSITLRQLSSHQSGLPREIPCDSNDLGTLKCTEDIIFEKLSNMYTIMPQYQQVHYSNLGVSLLGNALSKSLSNNISYNEYIEKYILSELNMTETTFNFTRIQNNLAYGVQLNNSNNEWELVTNRQSIGWSSPSGGLYSTSRDISKFIIFLLNGNENLIDSTTLNELFLPLSLDNDGTSAYGTPFEFYYDNNIDLWLHSKAGIAVGYRTQLALSKQFKLGLFFSSQYLFNTEDLFTKQILELIIPIYQEILQEIQNIDQLNNQKNYKNNNSLYTGYYSNDLNYNFNIYLDSNNQLIGNLNDNLLLNYTLIDFNENLPNIKRTIIEYPSKYICWPYYDGLNDELIYFNFTDNSLLILGQTIYKK